MDSPTTSANTESPLAKSASSSSASSSGSLVPLSITVPFAILGLLGVLANVLLLMALLTKKSRKVTSNFYLVNLAIVVYILTHSPPRHFRDDTPIPPRILLKKP
ncbi:hypothetical protein CAPTEDRAFT_189330 [Capitella teleta]|uniref:Uncharacterized protein n=1 Tax=Capitella teleta TaxID=283909 RepID=R7UKS5_CAPTE|nr:hypothetical protein CAPTEDRAFT_189330 [Capitella teleta]|eukprot:ELU06698.1 hypothetical protein CAPTEDRAFT_189330 [Capitella teleta]